ncbi:hypothetical protein M0208_05260 [Sphingomonas sp. SUN019]|uniref:hypothetical protein n=1 Tax=Sphingomonas sp. SUN019 TaxID=2937788 RepID=UPI002164C801|nr:hypothetical protein [Sphingomonas sp. SUN019]UVO49957.1 hypothetical protein M0208_05260 [Sphingomonas sp. SUN019]
MIDEVRISISPLLISTTRGDHCRLAELAGDHRRRRDCGGELRGDQGVQQGGDKSPRGGAMLDQNREYPITIRGYPAMKKEEV